MDDTARFARVLRFFNEAQSIEALAKQLHGPAGDPEAARKLAAMILAHKAAAGGMFTAYEQVASIPEMGPDKLASIAKLVETLGASVPGEPERTQFVSLLLKNPNYFGNIEGSEMPPVKPIQNNTSFEQLVCVGLNPPHDRLEAVIEIKKDTGYSGDICSLGSLEFVRFYVDLHNDGTFHDVGSSSVRVFDIPGSKPLCYAVYLDFGPYKKFCHFENIVKIRAILSWNVPSPPNSPNFNPVWGNRLDAKVQIQPAFFFPFGEILKDLKLEKVKIPDPIGPIIQGLDPDTKIPIAPSKPLSLLQKKELYKKTQVPVHRFAFQEATQLLAAPTAVSAIFTEGKSPLVQLGLDAKEIGSLIDKINFIPTTTDGDTSFEKLNCAGLKPNNDTLEGVVTVFKSTGYSGQLCSNGSIEYVHSGWTSATGPDSDTWGRQLCPCTTYRPFPLKAWSTPFL